MPTTDIKTQLDIIKSNVEMFGDGKALILPASKTRSAEVINSLLEHGISAVGENRVQELLAKYDSVSRDMHWHFIGRLQTNKVKYIIDKVDLIHSVDREELCMEIEKQASKISKVQDVLIEINCGNEEAKGGINFEDAMQFIINIATKYNHIKVCGLMGVMPITTDEQLDVLYQKLEALYHVVKNANISNTDIKYLSAGMSNDYILALKHGANIIRPGRILFGERV